jgi:cytochrome c
MVADPLHRSLEILSAAGYAMHNMSIGTTFNAPVLSDENAYDVAAYIIGQTQAEALIFNPAGYHNNVIRPLTIIVA